MAQYRIIKKEKATKLKSFLSIKSILGDCLQTFGLNQKYAQLSKNLLTFSGIRMLSNVLETIYQVLTKALKVSASLRHE